MEPNEYEHKIIKALLADKKFDITEIREINCINFLSFDEVKYNKIQKLILAQDIDKIRIMKEKPLHGEYLDILSFRDQNGLLYIVTIYDNDELLQDPQIIDLYRIS